MKKVTLLTTGILCAASIVIGASAAGVIQEIKAQLRPDFTVMVDGEVQTFRDANGNVVDPVLYEGTTYLPLRAIGQLMGKTVYWYEAEKKIELKDTTVTDADVIVPDGTSKPAEGTQQAPEQKPGATPPAASTENLIGEDRAKAIALEKAGLAESEVRMERVELDRDDGRMVYEVEFHKERVEYSAEISAADGTILSWDVDYDD